LNAYFTSVMRFEDFGFLCPKAESFALEARIDPDLAGRVSPARFPWLMKASRESFTKVSMPSFDSFVSRVSCR
jgi:hypothetical protein